MTASVEIHRDGQRVTTGAPSEIIVVGEMHADPATA
jgi:hypothetical protein